MKLYPYILLFIVILISCNKEIHRTKKFYKGETWQVNAIQVDGEPYGLKGYWYIETDINYLDSVPTINWKVNTLLSNFEWQFQDKGKTFVISYIAQNCESCLNDSEELNLQTYYLSGRYDVEKFGKKKIVLRSKSTKGFQGQDVTIILDRTL